MKFNIKMIMSDGEVYVGGRDFLLVLEAIDSLFSISDKDREEINRYRETINKMEKNHASLTRKDISKVKKVSKDR